MTHTYLCNTARPNGLFVKMQTFLPIMAKCLHKHLLDGNGIGMRRGRQEGEKRKRDRERERERNKLERERKEKKVEEKDEPLCASSCDGPRALADDSSGRIHAWETNPVECLPIGSL